MSEQKPFKNGAPDKYYSHVEPYLEEISRMALNMSEKQIAKELGVAVSSFNTYKHKHPELIVALKSGRRQLVQELKSTLIQKARGYTYTETKEVYNELGELQRKEVYHKTALPDTGAAHLLLKNLDSENWAENPQAVEFRRRELELQEKKFEETNWRPID